MPSVPQRVGQLPPEDLPRLDEVPDCDEFDLIERTRQRAQEIYDGES